LKNPILAGAIAGVVSGIVSIISAIIFLNVGLVWWWLPPPPNTPILELSTIEIVLGIIWGVILGVIYSKFYDAIPGKGIKKGLVYGLIIYLIYCIRTGTMNAVWGYHLEAIVWFFAFAPIIYGLLLGFLYEAPMHKMEVVKRDLKGGIHLGAIAGLIGGIAASSGLNIVSIIGFGPPHPTPPLTTLAALMVQDMGWGAIFGVLFVMFYDRIPGKGILRGLYFGLILYLITSFRVSTGLFAYGFFVELARIWVLPWIIASFFHFVALGLILGALYKKE